MKREMNFFIEMVKNVNWGDKMPPYIKQKNRKLYDKYIENIVYWFDIPLNRGNLNYVFSKIINRIIEKCGESYDLYNGLIGVLECIKFELYRKRVAKYEDIKEFENGEL